MKTLLISWWLFLLVDRWKQNGANTHTSLLQVARCWNKSAANADVTGSATFTSAHINKLKINDFGLTFKTSDLYLSDFLQFLLSVVILLNGLNATPSNPLIKKRRHRFSPKRNLRRKILKLQPSITKRLKSMIGVSMFDQTAMAYTYAESNSSHTRHAINEINRSSPASLHQKPSQSHV